MIKKNNKEVMHATIVRAGLVGAVISLVLGCVGMTEDDEQIKMPNDDVSGLKVSLSDYRFGVQEVGSKTPQTIVLRNVGVDTYPINSVTLSGEQAADYTAFADVGMTLVPGDTFDIDVTFSPVAEGQRMADLDIDYSVIKGVGSNAVEALYYNAKELENNGDNAAASLEYRRYIEGGATTLNKPRAMIKLSLLEEADVYGTGADFVLYRSALDLRDSGDIGGALQSLDALVNEYADSYLFDDALYMVGYIQMVDQNDYQTAYDSMQGLIDADPGSSYADTALYSQGLAEYELGNVDKAEEIFVSLRDRHTGVKVDLFEMQWPKDNYVSRLWFDKAEEQLETIQVAEVVRVVPDER